MDFATLINWSLLLIFGPLTLSSIADSAECPLYLISNCLITNILYVRLEVKSVNDYQPQVFYRRFDTMLTFAVSGFFPTTNHTMLLMFFS